MNKSFFEILNRKLLRKPSAKFDESFWRNFEREFGIKSSASRKIGWWENLQLGFKTPALGMAAALLVVTAISLYHRSKPMPLSTSVAQNETPDEAVDIAAAQSTFMAAHEPALLAHLDLYLEFEDISDISDEDWKVLLNTKVNASRVPEASPLAEIDRGEKGEGYEDA